MAIIYVRLLAKGLVVLLVALLPNHDLSLGSALFSFRAHVHAQAVRAVAKSFVPGPANRRPVGGAPPSIPFGARDGQVYELAGLRTRTSRTFAAGKGGYLTQISPWAINYRDAGGAYRPIDDTLVPTRMKGYAYQNRANRYTLYLPDDIARAPVKIAADGYWVSFALAGSRGRGKVSAATAVYSAVHGGVTATYTAKPDGVDETLTLPGPSAPATFTYALRASAGLAPGLSRAGGITFRTRAGQVVFTIPAPSMFDSRGASGAARFELSGSTSGYLLTITADQDWLHSPTRAWPVVIDPPVDLSIPLSPTSTCSPTTCSNSSSSSADTFVTRPPAAACTITSGTGTTCAVGANLLVGFNGTNPYRSLLQFDVSSIPKNAQIVDANLSNVWVTSSINSTVTAVGAYPVARAWTTSATWSTYDGSHLWSSPGGDFSSSPSATINVNPTSSVPPWPLTSLVQNWVSGSTANDGIVLKEPVENVNNVLQLSNTSSNPPELSVTYIPRLGERSFYKMDAQQLTDRLTAKVNVANGNLVLRQTDVHVKGTGLDLQVTRWYNNLVSHIVNDVGAGWLFDSGADVGLGKDIDGTVVYSGPGGYQASFAPTGAGTFGASAGIDATLVQNSDGTYTLSLHASGEKLGFSSQGYLLSRVDRNGNSITYAYSGSVLASITDTQGRVTSVTVNSSTSMVTVLSDPAGRSYRYGYSGPNLTSYTDPAGNMTLYAYDGSGNLSQITDPAGNVTIFAYDTQQRVTAITRVTDAKHGTGPTTTYTYNTGSGNCGAGTFAGNTVVTDPNGHGTTYCYDLQGLLTVTVDAQGNRTTTTYTADNHTAQAVDPLGGSTTLTYDTNNNVTSTTTPSSLQDAASYTDPSHPYSKTSQTNPEGNTTSIGYDANANVTSVTDPASQTQSSTYNANGTLATYTDGRGNSTSFAYDAHGNLTRITYPSPQGSTMYTYDSLSRVTSSTDGLGRTTTYSYDALDRTTKLAYGNGTSVTYTYDADDNKTSITDATGTTVLTYDKLNRVTQTTFPNGSSVSYAYDAVGNLVARTDSGGTEQRTYDSLNEPVSVTDQGGATTKLGYDANHRNTTVSYPNGVTETFQYDGTGLTQSVTATNAVGATLTRYTYSYVNPATGKTTSKRYSVVDTAGNTTKYTYDTLGRLTAAVQTNSSGQTTGSYQYSFDPNGNLTSQTIGSMTTSFTNNNDNQMVTAGGVAYSYDAAGDLISSGSGLSLSYNSAAQTVTVTPPGGAGVTMNYRDIGQTQRITAGTTAFQYDSTGLSQLTSSGQTSYFIHFVNGTPLSERIGSSTYYYLHDAMGSIVGIVNAAATLVNSYAYDPYGGIISQIEGVPNPFKWIGAVWDASTGLYKMGARYYSPALARFTQPDPLRIESPSYAYANGDPINGIDASGLFCCVSWWFGWAWWGYYGGTVFNLNHWDVQNVLFWWTPLAAIYAGIIGLIIGGWLGSVIGMIVGFVLGNVARYQLWSVDARCGCGAWVEVAVWGTWWNFFWRAWWYWAWS